jgi:hypothetical protein
MPHLVGQSAPQCFTVDRMFLTGARVDKVTVQPRCHLGGTHLFSLRMYGHMDAQSYRHQTLCLVISHYYGVSYRVTCFRMTMGRSTCGHSF